MKTVLLIISMLTNMILGHGQCTITTAESENKRVLFKKTRAAEIERDKKVIKISIVRVDTVEIKDRPTYYLTVAVDSLGNETVNVVNQVTLKIGKQKQINATFIEVIIPEFAFIFADNERFFLIDATILDEITRNQLREIQIEEEIRTDVLIYTVNSKQFAHQARCIKNAW